MRIRVVTLNAWGLPEPFAADVEPRMDAIAAAIPALEADVIAFQEIFSSYGSRRLVEAGRSAGLVNAWHRGASIGSSGLLVLSRLPIERVDFERYDFRGHPDRLAKGEYLSGKGFARVRLGTEAGPLTILNTHLHARYSSIAEHQYRPHRIGQIVQLARRSADTTHPILALGDFNFVESDPEHAVLSGLTGMRDVAAQLDQRSATAQRSNPYRQGSNKPDRRIDYVFARDGASVGVSPLSVRPAFDGRVSLAGRSLAYSDHAGVMADLEVGSGLGERQRLPAFDAVALASSLLAEGRAEAERLRSGDRRLAGLAVGCAALASAGTRRGRLSRRGFLRSALQGASLAALAPAVGFGVLSEVYRPDEIGTFRDAAEHLAFLEQKLHELLPS